MAVQVHKYLHLWQKLDLPELIGKLSAPRTAEQAAGSLGLLIVQRLVAGGSQLCLLHAVTVGPAEQASMMIALCVTGCQLMEALQPAIHKAAAALSAQLALSFFMPLCLTAFANLARLRVSAHSQPAPHLIQTANQGPSKHRNAPVMPADRGTG